MQDYQLRVIDEANENNQRLVKLWLSSSRTQKFSEVWIVMSSHD